MVRNMILELQTLVKTFATNCADMFEFLSMFVFPVQRESKSGTETPATIFTDLHVTRIYLRVFALLRCTNFRSLVTFNMLIIIAFIFCAVRIILTGIQAYRPLRLPICRVIRPFLTHCSLKSVVSLHFIMLLTVSFYKTKSHKHTSTTEMIR